MRPLTWRIVLVVLAATLLVVHRARMTGSDTYRIARDFAGDGGLPGARLWPGPDDVREITARLTGAGRVAYEQVLRMDDLLVLLTWLVFVSLALLAWHRLSFRWASALFVVATLAAASDCAENLWLRQMLAGAAASPTTFSAVAWATRSKWIFVAASVGLALVEVLRMLGPPRAWARALFLDVPYLVDSVSRRADFQLHRESRYDLARGEAEPRPWWRKPVFWLFGATVVFVSYGPTLDGICTIFPPTGPIVLLCAAGLAFLGSLAWIVWKFVTWLVPHLRWRLEEVAHHDERRERWRITCSVMFACFVMIVLPWFSTGSAILNTALSSSGICSARATSPASLERFALCAAAIALFALLVRRRSNTTAAMWTQALLLAGTAVIQWYFLAPPTARAADQTPYRHVFGVLAPVIFSSFCLAPLLAWAIFQDRPGLLHWFGLGITAETARLFRERLTERELFVADRRDPELTFGRLFQAFVRGTVYQPLQFLLLPSLVAFVVPADWVFSLTIGATVFSALVLTWGSMTSRWQQLARHLRRWFMTGTTFAISLFVIVVALLRIAKVAYVTTILDAAPFGVLFGTVLMSYLLSWLVEYWINRVAAVELLRLLGADRGAVQLRYELGADPTVPPDPWKHALADRDKRYLMPHGLGRFAVIGRVHRDDAGKSHPVLVFHSYDLLDVFRAIARPTDRDHVTDVARHLNVYFYALDALLILALAGFAGLYVHRTDSASAEPVATARASAESGHLIDLAARLTSDGGAARPAVIVVASGGGTRAALYTTHVLHGLHRLGVDGDIVLTSGVSGGGVALAYFTTTFEDLTGDRSEKRWGEFEHRVAEPFIQDVLGGASEWRIFGRTPLSMLLAESFERRLWSNQATTFEQLGAAPALILNTTMVGHPTDDSDLLGATLDTPTGDAAAQCEERQRPYRMMHGGRLIFTNLDPRSTATFPQRRSVIPDTRLPFRIIRDTKVPLARAAALTANFPPVFPNARVIVREEAGNCPERSYFVTDGGAQENLGLVSALFAVRSALQAMTSQTCGEPRPGSCPRPLRPIHFVIAEASAASYDYEEDRGVSAALSGAKERVTGGLIEELVQQTRGLHRTLSGRENGLRFHYLALPLAFRARGGFGTHWMHASEITMRDPRARWTPGWQDRVLAPFTDRSVTLDKADLSELWSALHDPQRPFCTCAPRFTHAGSDTVKRWICGERRDPAPPPRDVHVGEWKALVDALGDPSRLAAAPATDCTRVP